MGFGGGEGNSNEKSRCSSRMAVTSLQLLQRSVCSTRVSKFFETGSERLIEGSGGGDDADGGGGGDEGAAARRFGDGGGVVLLGDIAGAGDFFGEGVFPFVSDGFVASSSRTSSLSSSIASSTFSLSFSLLPFVSPGAAAAAAADAARFGFGGMRSSSS